MKFTEIYNLAVAYWPSEISIDDGYPTGKDGFMFPQLSAVWNHAEEESNSDHDLVGLAVWCMFQAFHSKAKMLFHSGANVLQTRSISPQEVEKHLSESLKVEGWAADQAEYENDLEPI